MASLALNTGGEGSELGRGSVGRASLTSQEFVDARRLQSLQNAPQVMYSNREPPLEIRHLPGLKNGEDWGYVTFGK